MEFRFMADVTFDAVNISDAFEKLEGHFAALEEGDTDDLRLIQFDGGSLEITPVENKVGE